MLETKSLSAQHTFDTVIHNAQIYSGYASESTRGMVGICGDKIAYVGQSILHQTSKSIDAQGCIVSPGFIDIHGHSDFSLLLNPHAESKIFQGVTTEVIGNCGLSGAPLIGEAYERWKDRYAQKILDIDWHEPEQYFDRLTNNGTAINVVPLLGHTNLRTIIKGYHGGRLTDSERCLLGELIDRYLSAGYWGISFGLAYPPGIFADQDEIELIMRHAAQHDVYISIHIRDEGPLVEQSLDEVLIAAKRTHCALQIAHLKSYGAANWHKLEGCIRAIENASMAGVSVHFDRYPYCAFNTDLDAIIPQQLFDGGWNQAKQRLQDPVIVRETIKYLQDHFSLVDADNIRISDICPSKRDLIGKSLSDILGRKKSTIWKSFIELLVEIDFQAEATFALMNKDSMKKVLTHPLCIVGSDSGVRSFDEKSKPHPRTYGTFTQFLKFVLDEKLMPLYEAIYKMTALPASKLGLSDRGILKEGYYADLILWDPKEIKELPTYDNPVQKSNFLKQVWINGQQVLQMGNNSQLYGRVLLRKQ